MATAPTRQGEAQGTLMMPILVKPGDLIGFSGADALSDLINVTTFGWPRRGLSHVAIITRHDGHLRLVESTTLNSEPCIIQEQPVSGAQMHSVSKRIKLYPGRVWTFPLTVHLTQREEQILDEYLTGLMESHCPYDYVGAIRSRSTLYAQVHRWKHGCEDLTSLFCSELVAAAWKMLGVFDTKNCSGWNPNALKRAALKQDTVIPPYRVM